VVAYIVGFSKYVKPGETVMLKPNFNTADPFPASTDIDFLKACIELCYEAGAKIVITGDSSTMSINTRKVMEEKGVFELLKMENPPRIYVFEERKWTKKEILGAKYLKSVSVPDIMERPDKLILLPCCKTHFQAKFTGALKLSVGYMKPVQRVALHMRNIEEKIAELNLLVNSDLVIMDARKIFINEGPNKGEVAEPGILLASENRVDIDVEAIKLIQSYPGNSLKGMDPEVLKQIKLAREIGIDKVK
jgi:uncharacterized protein (DUF362 family)